MDLSKTEIPSKGEDLKNNQKKKRRNIYKLFIIPPTVLLIFIVLFLYKPIGFKGGIAVDNEQVSPYLTHILSPQLYNGAERQEPFDLVISQEGINDIISRYDWPIESNGARYLPPKVLFKPDRIVIIGTVSIGAVELMVTIIGQPRLDENGLLNLNITKIKVGAMNFTIVAKLIAGKMYTQKLADTTVDSKDIGTKIVASLFNDESFKPVFSVNDNKVCIKTISITSGQLKIGLVPAS